MCREVCDSPKEPMMKEVLSLTLKRCATAFKIIVVYVAAAYITWTLVGTVAFVSHLGEQAPWLAPFLPGGGQPGGVDKALEAEDVVQFLRLNAMPAFRFVVPHSVLRPKRLSAWLGRVGLQLHDRLMYNAIAAATLHHFLATSVPLRTPVVMEMPLLPSLHLMLSGGCLLYATVCFLADEGTPILLGVARSLEHADSSRLAGMDAITWMGECVWRRGGSVAFVLFTGLSILPPQLSFGDGLTRVVAAMYLRARSSSFRRWVEKIEGAHQLTWVLRAGLLAVALQRASQSGEVALRLRSLCDWRLLAALGVAAALRAFEVFGSRWSSQARAAKPARLVQRDAMSEAGETSDCCAQVSAKADGYPKARSVQAPRIQLTAWSRPYRFSNSY